MNVHVFAVVGLAKQEAEKQQRALILEKERERERERERDACKLSTPCIT